MNSDEPTVRQLRNTHLLGQLTWKPADLEPEDWASHIIYILQQHGEPISDAPCYKAICERMNGWQGSESLRPKTDPNVVEMPDGLSFDTPCYFLARISHMTEGDASKEHPFGSGAQYVYEKDLFLTKEGRLVLSDRKYERVFSSTGEGPGEYEQRDVTEWWRLSYCEPLDFKRVCNHEVGPRIVTSLGRLAANGVAYRRIQLQQVTDAHMALLLFNKGIGNAYADWHKLE
ncbi:MAG TPA: hypothetical protein VGP13_01770 [Candidatus Paceibacterota bacterium]|jgi:hypothetical protein|nr:hypothetical protein [Candidatus Paceibacterota bacterium]